VARNGNSLGEGMTSRADRVSENPKFGWTLTSNQCLRVAGRRRSSEREAAVSDRDVTHSDLVEIAKRNGDFKKNYGVLVGAILYLRSISAARPRLFWWQALIAALAAALGFWWR
jgi:hypothetical protein